MGFSGGVPCVDRSSSDSTPGHPLVFLISLLVLTPALRPVVLLRTERMISTNLNENEMIDNHSTVTVFIPDVKQLYLSFKEMDFF